MALIFTLYKLSDKQVDFAFNPSAKYIYVRHLVQAGFLLLLFDDIAISRRNLLLIKRGRRKESSFLIILSLVFKGQEEEEKNRVAFLRFVFVLSQLFVLHTERRILPPVHQGHYRVLFIRSAVRSYHKI